MESGVGLVFIITKTKRPGGVKQNPVLHVGNESYYIRNLQSADGARICR